MSAQPPTWQGVVRVADAVPGGRSRTGGHELRWSYTGGTQLNSSVDTKNDSADSRKKRPRRADPLSDRCGGGA